MENAISARALLLFSGSLDSQLAACLLREAGIGVHGLVFTSPFFDGTTALEAAQALDLPLTEIDFTSRMVRTLQSYPTLDEPSAHVGLACHTAMIRDAAERMEEFGCSFLATGEVLNQRTPMQTREAFDDIENGAPFAGWIVRPLSGSLLPETQPERNGWINRASFLDLSGPGRQAQVDCAAQFGLAVPPESAGPAGRLADPLLAARLKDLRAHEGLEGQRALALLGVGRHFRLGPVTKLILGESERERSELQSQAELYELLIEPRDSRGPLGLLPLIAPEDQVRTAAALCARCAGAPAGQAAVIRIRSSRGARHVEVPAASDRQVELLEI